MNHLVLHDGRTVWPGDRLVLEDEDEIERTVTEVGVDLVRLAANDSWLLRTLKEAGVEKQATQPQQKEQKTENNTMSDFSRGISETILASKVNTYEAAATALTTSANKAMVAEIAALVEDVSPEFASFLRTELGRPAALYLAAVVLHGASTTGALPFAPEALQSYAERTQFGAVYEASSLLTDGLLEKMKTTVFGHLMDWGSKMEALAQRAEVSA